MNQRQRELRNLMWFHYRIAGIFLVLGIVVSLAVWHWFPIVAMGIFALLQVMFALDAGDESKYEN